MKIFGSAQIEVVAQDAYRGYKSIIAREVIALMEYELPRFRIEDGERQVTIEQVDDGLQLTFVKEGSELRATLDILHSGVIKFDAVDNWQPDIHGVVNLSYLKFQVLKEILDVVSTRVENLCNWSY